MFVASEIQKRYIGGLHLHRIHTGDLRGERLKVIEAVGVIRHMTAIEGSGCDVGRY